VDGRLAVDIGLTLVALVWDLMFVHPALGLFARATPALAAVAVCMAVLSACVDLS
jgi:hypothetical protein